VVLLFVSAAMASLPTTADPDATITAFYRDHGAVVVAQQVLGAIALVPLVLFALSLDLNRWLRPALFVFVAVELVTNLVPLLILAAPGAAHPLTVAEDLADSALFACVALFVIVLTLVEPLWLRTLAYVVAAACAARAVAGLFGITAVDPVGIADEDVRPTASAAQGAVGHREVILHDLELRDARFGEIDLPRIRDRDLATSLQLAHQRNQCPITSTSCGSANETIAKGLRRARHHLAVSVLADEHLHSLVAVMPEQGQELAVP